MLEAIKIWKLSSIFVFKQFSWNQKHLETDLFLRDDASLVQFQRSCRQSLPSGKPQLELGHTLSKVQLKKKSMCWLYRREVLQAKTCYSFRYFSYLTVFVIFFPLLYFNMNINQDFQNYNWFWVVNLLSLQDYQRVAGQAFATLRPH